MTYVRTDKKIEMLRDLRDWMGKYDVYIEAIYYDYPRILIMDSTDQTGIVESNGGYTFDKRDIDDIFENMEKAKWCI